MKLKQIAATGVVTGLSLLATIPAMAADPTDALGAITTLSATNASYGPVMFGLAIAAVGVMIGVKWIKRARGAA